MYHKSSKTITGSSNCWAYSTISVSAFGSGQSVHYVATPNSQGLAGVSVGCASLSELSNAATVEDERFFWRSGLPEGTARQECRFTDVEAGRCWVVRYLCGFNLVFDGDMQHSVCPVQLQSELTSRQFAIEQIKSNSRCCVLIHNGIHNKLPRPACRTRQQNSCRHCSA